MPSPEENYLLLWSLLHQKMTPAGALEGIDYNIVAQNLGLDKPGTASVRFIRLKEEFSKLGFPGLPDKSNGNSIVGKAGAGAMKAKAKEGKEPKEPKQPKEPKSPNIKKVANPKARSAVEKKSGGAKGKGSAKTRAAKTEEEADDVEEEVVKDDGEDSEDAEMAE